MASVKNVHALNNRLEQACRDRVGDFYRQHVSSLAQLEHEKLEAARLLKAVKKCPSDHELLSIKFLGPAPKSSQRRRGRQQQPPPPQQQQQQQQQQQEQQQEPLPSQSKVAEASDAELTTTATVTATAETPSGLRFNRGFTQSAGGADPERRQHKLPRPGAADTDHQGDSAANPFAPPVPGTPDRSKTFAQASANAEGHRRQRSQHRQQQQQQQQHRRARAKTPFARKLERFYGSVEATKLCGGLPVVDSTQTETARQFRGTLSRAEWRVKLAKLDPEYFKNLAILSDSSGDESQEED